MQTAIIQRPSSTNASTGERTADSYFGASVEMLWLGLLHPKRTRCREFKPGSMRSDDEYLPKLQESNSRSARSKLDKLIPRTYKKGGMLNSAQLVLPTKLGRVAARSTTWIITAEPFGNNQNLLEQQILEPN